MIDQSLPDVPRPADPPEVHLRLLATSDLHAHLMPWDYMADRPSPTGLAQLAPLIHSARAGVANSLLVDNGDFIQGSPLGDWQMGAAPHPMIAAMNALGYDAATLGNHEFSHGLPFLVAALADARFPVVSANLTRSDGAPLVPAFVLLDRAVTDTAGRSHRLRLAITGFAPPQTTQWEALRLNGSLRAADILTAARSVLDRITPEKPDLTIALAHTGMGETAARHAMENAAIPLAAAPEIDVLVTGHTHLLFPDGQPALQGHPADTALGTLHGKPAVMPGFHGSHLGVIDLTLRQTETGWAITAHKAALLPATAIPAADPALARLARGAHQATLDRMRQPLGHGSGALHSHFALVAPSAALHLIAQSQRAYWRDRVPADLAHLPLLAAVAPFRSGGRGGPDNVTDIPAGPLLNRHVADLYPHPNTPALLCLSASEVADWLERAAILFHRIAPAATDAPLIRPDIPGFDFDVIDGLSFRIDLTQPPRFDAKGSLLNPDARRITALGFNGESLRPDQRFLLATNSYRAGSTTYPGTTRPPVATTQTPIRDILAAHIAALGTIAARPGALWGFAPTGGATVTFDSSPDADRHSAEIAQYRPEPLGRTATGFLRFRLSL